MTTSLTNIKPLEHSIVLLNILMYYSDQLSQMSDTKLISINKHCNSLSYQSLEQIQSIPEIISFGKWIRKENHEKNNQKTSKESN